MTLPVFIYPPVGWLGERGRIRWALLRLRYFWAYEILYWLRLKKRPDLKLLDYDEPVALLHGVVDYWGPHYWHEKFQLSREQYDFLIEWARRQ